MRDTILNMNYKELEEHEASIMKARRGCNKPLTRLVNYMIQAQEVENKFFMNSLVKQHINSKK